MNTTTNVQNRHSERAYTITSTTTINEVSIDHTKLGTEAWEWEARDQAAFLAAFAAQLRNAGINGLMQLNYIADKLDDNNGAANVRWLLDTLTEHLDNPADGAPRTQAEVTSGYVNPSQERMDAWLQKQELTR